jgi:hypothetical protein
MAEPRERGSKLRVAFTRPREMPESLRPFTVDLFHPLSDRTRRDARAASKLGLSLVAYGLALASIGWVLFSLIWLR